MRHITIRWDAPRSIGQVRLMTDQRDDYGLYQIYGTHPESREADTLLYIGRAGAGEEAGTFSDRFNRHHYIEKYCAKGGQREEISIRIGRVRCKRYTGLNYWSWPDSDWIPLVRDTEAILIHHHYDQLCNEQREKWKQSLSIENTGDFGSLDKQMSYEAQS